jgi:hypothetical protein
MRPDRVPALVVVKKAIRHNDLASWVLGMRGQDDANEPVTVQGRLDQSDTYVDGRADQQDVPVMYLS